MPCSSSSNIRSSQTLVTVTQGGSRLTATIPAASYASGITAGDVIFYNPISPAQYQKSNAGASNTAEVFGLVESVSDVGGGLYSLNVVIYGSIVLPSSAINTISGATGGAGGADIYFLSETSGKIQIEAPTNVGSVIKPIYQAAPHGGSYTGTIINYIGYRLGGEIQAFDSSASSLTVTKTLP